MLTDAEYCKQTGLTIEELNSLTEEEELFTHFEFDCGAMRNRDGSLMFPELGGKYTPLFTVQRTQTEVDNFDWRVVEKQMNLAKYIQRGFAFEPPPDGVDSEDNDDLG